MGFSTSSDRRFARAVRSSGLVADADLDRALQFQEQARDRGRDLPLDRILLKFNLLERKQILKLWRALRYYLWRKEDKFYVKIAVQSKLFSEELAASLLREQKKAYKYDDELLRVNEIARQRGHVKSKEDEAIIEAMNKVRPVSLTPVEDDVAERPPERQSPRAARKGEEDAWREKSRRNELASLRAAHAESASGASARLGKDLFALSESGDLGAVSDEDLDALWAEADLDDVELDSQAVEIARSPLDLEDSDEGSGLF
ncbi:MAG: hypothetical protein KDD82_23095 [Planctomycetes bacterium]|nr:hypothetical protein [Planctomycetota bacterium]